MKAVCWMGTEKMSVENVPDPQILNPRDAIVRITRTAICGSDLHLYDGFIPTMEQGDIVGHEFMGEVVEVGPAISREAEGRRPGRGAVHDRLRQAASSASSSCGRCCDNSNPNSWIAEKTYGLLAVRPVRLLAHDGRLRRRPGAVRARALCRCWAAQDSGRNSRREGAVPFRHFSHRLHGRGELQHSARRHGRHLGLRSGWTVRHSQRVHAGSRAGHRHRSLRVSPADGAQTAEPRPSTTSKWIP